MVPWGSGGVEVISKLPLAMLPLAEVLLMVRSGPFGGDPCWVVDFVHDCEGGAIDG